MIAHPINTFSFKLSYDKITLCTRKTIIDFKVGPTPDLRNPIREPKAHVLTMENSWQRLRPAGERILHAVGYVSYEAAPAFEESSRFIRPAPRRNTLLYFTIHDKAEEAFIPLTMRKWKCQRLGRGWLLSKSTRNLSRPFIIISARRYLSGQLHDAAARGANPEDSWLFTTGWSLSKMRPTMPMGAWRDRNLVHQPWALFEWAQRSTDHSS